MTVISALMTRVSLPEVKDAYTIVSRHESHRGIPESSNVTESKLNATSFAANSFNNIKRGNNNNNTRGPTNIGGNRGPNLNFLCKNYGMIGHTIKRYCVTLLSVNKLIKDSKMFVGFDEDKCYIQNLKREKTLGTSSESGGLYLLGQPADQVISVLKIDLNLFKNTYVFVSEVFHRIKQAREPFPVSDHKFEKVGELVHLDL
ncbi:hypothetical protein Tco_0112140 [Tanacetum coccineum]